MLAIQPAQKTEHDMNVFKIIVHSKWRLRTKYISHQNIHFSHERMDQLFVFWLLDVPRSLKSKPKKIKHKLNYESHKTCSSAHAV